MNYETSNPIKKAIDKIGGPTKAAHALKVSNATIHNWINRERVPDIDKAKALSAASGISAHVLREAA